MNHLPDQARSDARLVVESEISPFVPGDGAIDVTPLGEGHSNLTFRVQRNGRAFVLRRPPRPPFAPSAHDVLREFRVLDALVGEGVAAPIPIAACEGTPQMGVPFYVMELVEGVAIRSFVPDELNTPLERSGVGMSFVDELVKIHAVPCDTDAMRGLGRPTGYLERQLKRWNEQWSRTSTRSIAAIEFVSQRLRATMPTSPTSTLVHGDYKIDNALFAAGAPARVAAVLDWELATIGDPLADLGFLLATYVEATDPPDDILDFSPATRLPGFPTRGEIRDRYAERSGRSTEGVGWYEAFATWKLAILLEGSYRRYVEGAADDPFFARLEAGVPRLAERARSLLS